MMLPVLLSKSFVYNYMLASKYMVDICKYDTSDFAVVQVMIRLSIYSDDSRGSHVMVYK